MVTAVLVVVVGGLGFLGGTLYQKSKVPSLVSFGGGMARNGQQIRVGNGNGGTVRSGFRPVAGEIISADDKSITVKMTDGSSKIVLISDKTNIGKTSEATTTDLKTGEKVSVFGTENSDGSVSAQNIQLNPEMGRVMMTTPAPTK